MIDTICNRTEALGHAFCLGTLAPRDGRAINHDLDLDPGASGRILAGD